MIINPILPGFNPDPSICRVHNDYYIATSTFEWYPGVQIHHSTDLANWKLVKRPLDRANQLDMRGNPDSCGVWAPCLSHDAGLFWLVYTDVKRLDGAFKDAHNYIVCCDAIDGDWSRLVRIVRLGVFVASDATFTDQPKVVNGASDLIVEIFGDKGKHARFAVGAPALPFDVAVEIDAVFEIG